MQRLKVASLKQAREVFAVPGKVDSLTSQGTNHLLKQGARLVTSVEDILEELRLELSLVAATEAGENRVPSTIAGAGPAVVQHRRAAACDLTDEEQRLLAQLQPKEPVDVDALAAQAGLPASTCAAVLLGLELKHLVKQLPGKRFITKT